MWTVITDIPVKVLTNNILPFCEAKDVLSLGCTNKFFALVTADDAFWRLKLAVDYNFTGSETARTSGWKFIYQKLRNPRVFVWGYVAFPFFYVMRRLFVHWCASAYSSDFNRSEMGSGANLGCHDFQGWGP